jgi:hypothetical protein
MAEYKSLNDVCYQQIKDNFYYGLFGHFRLVIDKATGCFNATKLCNEASKRFRNWSNLEKSKRLLEYYSRGCDRSANFYEIKGDNKNDLVAKITAVNKRRKSECIMFYF